MEQDAKDNETKGAKYRDSFAKEKGVKKTESGLLYLVEKPGAGEAPKDSDTVVVNYKGTLTDGTEFDNSLHPRRAAVVPSGRRDPRLDRRPETHQERRQNQAGDPTGAGLR